MTKEQLVYDLTNGRKNFGKKLPEIAAWFGYSEKQMKRKLDEWGVEYMPDTTRYFARDIVDAMWMRRETRKRELIAVSSPGQNAFIILK